MYTLQFVKLRPCRRLYPDALSSFCLPSPSNSLFSIPRYWRMASSFTPSPKLKFVLCSSSSHHVAAVRPTSTSFLSPPHQPHCAVLVPLRNLSKLMLWSDFLASHSPPLPPPANLHSTCHMILPEINSN